MIYLPVSMPRVKIYMTEKKLLELAMKIQSVVSSINRENREAVK